MSNSPAPYSHKIGSCPECHDDAILIGLCSRCNPQVENGPCEVNVDAVRLINCGACGHPLTTETHMDVICPTCYLNAHLRIELSLSAMKWQERAKFWRLAFALALLAALVALAWGACRG